MSQKKIFLFWLPLFASWLLMTAEAPIIHTAITRLPQPIISLAAFGIVMSLSVTIESPIIMLLATSTALATFDKLDDAGRAVSQIMYSGIIPSALEILGRHTILAINQDTDLNLPEVDAMLLVETDGYTREETNYQIQKVIDIFNENNPKEVKRARTEAEAIELWAARNSAYGVLARIRTHFVLEDVTVPMANIADFLKGIEAIAKAHNLQIATFGHAGDGNLHPQILYDGYDPDEVKRVEAASADLFRLAIDLEGTLTGEHGIGLSKAPFMTLEHDPVAMDVMQTIKKTFDPNNILNPGKMALDR
jgi:glycolate oxidase